MTLEAEFKTKIQRIRKLCMFVRVQYIFSSEATLQFDVILVCEYVFYHSKEKLR